MKPYNHFGILYKPTESVILMIDDKSNQIANLTHDAVSKTGDKLVQESRDLGHHHFLALFLLGKTVTSFCATWYLCKNGYGQDAMVIVRTIFENLVTIAYINKDPASRVPLFLEHDYIKAHKRVGDYKKLYPEKQVAATIESTIKSQYEKYKNRYPNANRWSNKTLLNMSKECGLEHYYFMVYRFGSIFAHSGSDSIQDYLTHSNEEKHSHYSFRFGEPDKDKTDLSLITACSLVLITIQETCVVFNIEPPENCIPIINEINNMAENDIYSF